MLFNVINEFVCFGVCDYIIEYIFGLDIGSSVSGFVGVNVCFVILLCGFIVLILVIIVVCL